MLVNFIIIIINRVKEQQESSYPSRVEILILILVKIISSLSFTVWEDQVDKSKILINLHLTKQEFQELWSNSSALTTSNSNPNK